MSTVVNYSENITYESIHIAIFHMLALGCIFHRIYSINLFDIAEVTKGGLDGTLALQLHQGSTDCSFHALRAFFYFPSPTLSGTCSKLADYNSEDTYELHLPFDTMAKLLPSTHNILFNKT